MLKRLLGIATSRPELDYGRVASWLVIGPAMDADGYAHLAATGVTHVLDLRAEASDDPTLMERFGLMWRRVPIADAAAPAEAQLAEIQEWLDAAEDPVVYVHCQGGLGRSPTIAIALLMSRGQSLAQARRLVLGARGVAAPTPSQHQWLMDLEHERSQPAKR